MSLPIKTNRLTFCVSICLLLGCCLRFVGLTRGSSDFVLPSQARMGQETAFYHFHPDEAALIQAALALDDPLEPPLTAYGMVPIYLLRAWFELTSLIPGTEPLISSGSAFKESIYYSARTLASLISCLGLWLVWLLGHRYFGQQTACLALGLVAVAPLAIQQAHFFTADGPFMLLTVATCYALLTAISSAQLRWYVFTGILLGATAAVRMHGLLLVAVLVVGHCLGGTDQGTSRTFTQIRTRLLERHLWLAAGTAALVLILLQPFLITDPNMLWRNELVYDFASAVDIAQGKLLRTWNLVDVHTPRYLHHWVALWPVSVGWPLTVAFILGLGYALRKLNLTRGVILLLCALYFVVVGGLHTKLARYLLPLLPFFCLCTADLCSAIYKSPTSLLRTLGIGLTGALVLYTAIYGLAFTRIYIAEDSRIQAGRWIAEHVAPGSSIGVEGGGFSLQSVIGNEQYRQRSLNIGPLIGTRGYWTCGSTISYLQDRLFNHASAPDYIAIIDVNRLRQFTAVPELFPMVAEFYQLLVNEQLGYTLVKRFKEYPKLGSITFVDDSAEPSFLGFDHPAVLVFKRRDQVGVETAWERWRSRIAENPHCADYLLERTVDLIQAGQRLQAQQTLETVLEQYPLVKTADLIAAMVHQDLADAASAQAAFERYKAGYHQGSSHLIPWASGMTLVELGFPDLALILLGDTAAQLATLQPESARSAANSYNQVGDQLYLQGRLEDAQKVYQWSTEIAPGIAAYNQLAFIAYRSAQFSKAVILWEHSLELDNTQADIHATIGQIALRHLGDQAKSLRHLDKATQLDPQLGVELADWVAEAEATEPE